MTKQLSPNSVARLQVLSTVEDMMRYKSQAHKEEKTLSEWVREQLEKGVKAK